MRGNKRTFPNFHFSFVISVNSNYFQHKTLERRWHDFFHLFKWQGVLKIFEFHLKIFPISETLCNSMIFTREDKMTSSNYEIWVGSLKLSNLNSFRNYFQFGVIWVLFKLFFSKIKYMEIRVTWFPTTENGRKINLKPFWYF